MNNAKNIFVASLLLLPIITTAQVLENQNRIRTRQYTGPFTSPGVSATYRTTTDYYDGLGQHVEKVLKRGGGNGNDLVYLTEIDKQGLETAVWLPIESDNQAGEYTPKASLKLLGQSLSQYGDTILYSQSIYEHSPLNRKKHQYGPGASWREAERKQSYRYLTNEEAGLLSCEKFRICWQHDTIALLKRFMPYQAGTLVVEEQVDEDGRMKWEFRDHLDRLILTKELEDSITTRMAETYYQYDELGRLEAVLPPLLVEYAKTHEDETIRPYGGCQSQMDNLAYLYRYDSRGNCLASKFPQCGWSFMLYDHSDYCFMKQDANQRKRGVWGYSLIDVFGRECIRGELTLSVSLNPFACPFEDRYMRATRVDDGGVFGYDLGQLSFAEITSPDIVNWYDDYSFRGDFGIPSGSDIRVKRTVSAGDGGIGDLAPEQQMTGGYSSSRGLLTGSVVKIFGGDAINPYLWTVRYYDHKGHEVQVNSSNQNGSSERVEKIYAFTDEVLGKRITHGLGQNITMTEQYEYEYDYWGRLLLTKHKINNKDWMPLHGYSYDSALRVIEDERGNINSLKTDYKHNVRSWTTEITVGVEGETYHEHLFYHQLPQFAELIPGMDFQPSWVGKIARMDWRAGNDGKVRSFVYKYDALSRLVNAEYGESIVGKKKSTSYNYDLNSNLKTQIDTVNQVILRTDYSLIGNQVINTFPSLVMPEIRSGSLPIIPIDVNKYDEMGRLTFDTDEGMTITYNPLSLPLSVTKQESGHLVTQNYSYAADGRKLRISFHSTELKRYEGNLVYENGALSKMLIDDGYVSFPDTVYHFFVKDHLGNTRLVVDEDGCIEQIIHYGPYGEDMGMSLESLPAGAVNSEDNLYKWGGKELDNTLSSYDFGARYYSTSMRRWTTPDMLAELDYSKSPYVYCSGDPVNHIDPDGRVAQIVAGAVIGGSVSGAIAWYEGKTGSEFWGAVAGGAIGGAITVASAGAVQCLGGTALLGETIGGLVGGAAQSVTEQAISSDSIDARKVAVAGGVGALGGNFFGRAKSKYSNVANKVLDRIQSKYSSTGAQKMIREEVKKEMKAAGKVLGTSGKKELKNETAERIKNYVEVETEVVVAVNKGAKYVTSGAIDFLNTKVNTKIDEKAR